MRPGFGRPTAIGQKRGEADRQTDGALKVLQEDVSGESHQAWLSGKWSIRGQMAQ